MQRYRLGRDLHRGRIASIFEAEVEGDHGFSRKVALKVLSEEASSDERASFQDEAEILSRIRHSNVIAVFDFGTLDEKPYLAMELIDGISVELASEQGRVPMEAALFVIREVALALAHVHELGVIHRDVTPNNLMLAWDGSVKLCDFGIAFAAKRRNPTSVGVGKGTPGYLPLEQRTGSAVDARTDVFSLGCVLHRMLAGRSPALDPSQIEIDPDLPKLAASIVRRAVQLNPKERYQSAAELGLAAADALTELGSQDARTILIEWIAPLREPTAREAHPLVALFGDPASDEPRRRTQVERREEESITPADAASQLVGEMVHGYRLLECIGRGRSADVFLAEHQVLRHQAAVKIFRAVADGERGLRQAQALARLWHPGFVVALDSGLLPDGRRFVITELVRGKTLDKLQRAVPSSSVIGQIASAIAEAHRHGIVHRSLSPANVMVGETGLVKVLGFGSVKIPSAGEVTEALGLRADPTYFAPEQFIAPSDCGPSADVYALGVIAFELLEGHPPFSGSRYEVEKLHGAAPIPSLARHGGFGRLVDRMLAKDPQRRPSAAQVASEIAALSESKRRIASSGAMLALLFVAIAVLCGAAVKLFLHTRKAVPQERMAHHAEQPPPVGIVPAQLEEIEAPQIQEVAAELVPPAKQARAKRSSRIDPERELEKLLRARHLERSDLIADPAASSLLERLNRDPEVLAELSRAADRIARQPAVVERKLGALGRTLSELGDKLEVSELRALESEYFELRRGYRPSLDGEAAFELIARIDRLERKLRDR